MKEKKEDLKKWCDDAYKEYMTNKNISSHKDFSLLILSIPTEFSSFKSELTFKTFNEELNDFIKKHH